MCSGETTKRASSSVVRLRGGRFVPDVCQTVQLREFEMQLALAFLLPTACRRLGRQPKRSNYPNVPRGTWD
eukprot:651430-Pleurochrysis_carterae.AAC.1